MANKPFEIQSSSLLIGGVELAAGTTSIVIPGVSRAASYRVEEVEETGEQTNTLNLPIVIDNVTHTAKVVDAGASTLAYATYTVELDDEDYIDEIEVNTAGTYVGSEVDRNGDFDMWGYIGSDAAGYFLNWVTADWVQIPFRPKMRAADVELEGGGGGSLTVGNGTGTSIQNVTEILITGQITQVDDGVVGITILTDITGAQIGAQITINNTIDGTTPDLENASSINYIPTTTLNANDWIGSGTNDPNTYSEIRFANGNTFLISGWNTDAYPDTGNGTSGFITLDASGLFYTGAEVWPITITSYNYVAGTTAGRGIEVDGNVWKFDESGILTVPGEIQSQGLDNLVLRSKDNINLYAGNAPGDNSEGGDINIYAGQGDPDNGGGDIIVRGGQGGDMLGQFDTGNNGGFVQLRGGYSTGISDGGPVELIAGSSDRGKGGEIRIRGGYGSDDALKLDNVAITNISLDTPILVTLAVDHNLNYGDAINFANITTTTQLNNTKYYVIVASNNTVTLFEDRELTIPVSGAGMTPYSSPGVLTITTTSVNAQQNNYFSQYIANAPEIGSVQVGWTVTGPGLNGTKTVIAVNPVDPVVITVDGSDGSVFSEFQSYTFAEPSITGSGTAYSSAHGGDIILQPGSTFNSSRGDIGRTFIRGETQIGNDGGSIWKFGVDGALTLPSGSPILFGNGNSRIQAGMGFHINSEEGISLEAVNTTDPLNSVTKNWTFGSTGQMTFPQGTVLAELVSGPTNAFGIFANAVPGRTALIRTQPSSAGFNYDWEFGNNGILTLPNTGKVAVTGVTAAYLADRETAYNDSQGMYFDAVFQWARIDNSFSPIWFNLPGRLAYDQIIAWTPPTGVTPVPANIVVLANACKMNYAAWQEAITYSKLTVKSDTVNWEFDSAGKLTLPQGGVIAGGEAAAIQAAYTAWQEEEAGWQAVITTGGADLNVRPWNFAGPSPEEKLATVNAMWMEQQRPGTILDWVPISAAHYNDARAWLFVTSNTDGYRLWKKLTTGVTITADEKSWAFTNDGILTLPGDIVKLESDATDGLIINVSTFPGYTAPYKFDGNGNSTSRAISVTDANGVRVGGIIGDGFGPILNAPAGKQVWISTNGMHLWRFTADSNFVLPPNGDILDSNGTSVIANTGELVGTGVTSVGTALTINDDGSGGLVGWGPQALSVASNSEILSETYTAGSTITWQDGSTATITQIDNYPGYHDIFWDTPKSGTLFPITLKTSDYVEAVPFTARITASDKQWTFVDDGKLTLPSGSVISETASTISIAPPTAAAGQSLVIRPTAATWSVNSSGFISYGNPITVTVEQLQTGQYFGTINYVISGPGVTEQSLGRPLTGTVVITRELGGSQDTVTWTIPAISNITEFTFTLTTVNGTRSTNIETETNPALYYSFEELNMPTGHFVTVTNNGMTNSETSHVHLISGNPITTDIYLGDDDQFVKIEKNGGNVVVGTNANTKNWTFAQNGSLTLPNAGIIRTGNNTSQIGSTRTIATDSNEGTGAGTPNVVDVAYDNTIIPTYYYSGGGNPVFTDSTITFANGDVRTITSIVATGGYIDIAYDGTATTSSPEFPIILKTGNYAAATTAPEWKFGTDGSTVFPNAKVKGYCFTTTNTIINYIPQSGQFMYTDSEILRLVQAGWWIKGPGLIGWKQITAVQDNAGVALIIRIGGGNTPLEDGSEFHSGGHLPTNPDLVYTVSQYLELDVQVADKTWTFSENGTITLPAGMTIETAYGGGPTLVVDGKTHAIELRSDDTILIGYNDSSGNVYIGNPAGTGQVDIVGPKFRVFADAPTASTGAVGDQAGQIAFNGSYIYYCTADYSDGLSNIWKRVAWSGDTW